MSGFNKHNHVQKKLVFTVDHNQKIIFETLSGFVKTKDLLEFKEKEITSPGYNPAYSIITDMRKASLDFHKSNIEDTIKYLTDDLEKHFSFKKCAIVTSAPQHVAVSKLFELKTSDLVHGRLKIFSTYEAALSWIVEE